MTGTPTATPDSVLNRMGVRTFAYYGGRADEASTHILRDAAITSGATTLTSATASFTAADVGKPISVEGAGAAGVELATTIASINGATSVELTASAGTTVSDAVAYYGTDNTTALQDVFDAAGASTGLALRVLVPPGVYMVAGPILGDTYGVIKMPYSSIDAYGSVLELIGQAPLPTAQRGVTGWSHQPHGAIFKFTAQASSAQTYACFNTETGQTRSAFGLRMKDICIRTQDKALLGGICARELATLDLQDCHVETGKAAIVAGEPTTANMAGVILPYQGNQARVHMARCYVSGFYEGIHLAEHAHVADCYVNACKTAFVHPSDGSYHAQRIVRCDVNRCATLIEARSLCILDGDFAIETLSTSDSPTWQRAATVAISDASNYLRGRIRYNHTITGTGGGLTNAVTRTGALYCVVSPMTGVPVLLVKRTDTAYTTGNAADGASVDAAGLTTGSGQAAGGDFVIGWGMTITGASADCTFVGWVEADGSVIDGSVVNQKVIAGENTTFGRTAIPVSLTGSRTFKVRFQRVGTASFTLQGGALDALSPNTCSFLSILPA